ncbi:MAG: hypothetical protein H6R00_626 [Proteobacteria bacterium]|nr:hypothetical protein [Pseudomonadota bacterium]
MNKLPFVGGSAFCGWRAGRNFDSAWPVCQPGCNEHKRLTIPHLGAKITLQYNCKLQLTCN